MPVRFPEIVPVLTDGTVTLRAHAESDLPAILEFGTDPLMQRWTTIPRDYDGEAAKGLLALVAEDWERPVGDRVWAIEFTDDEGRRRFGGNVDLRPTTIGTATVGYGLHPAARGRGLMARAVRLACRHAFTTGLGDGPVQRIHWQANVGNFPSRRVAWACGFTMHGTLPDAVGLPGHGTADTWMASLAPDESMEPRTAWLEAAEVDGDGIRLRPWRPDDRDRIQAFDDPTHFMPVGAAMTDETFDEWLLERESRMADGTGIYWCVADAATDEPLGSVMLFEKGEPMVPPSAEVGYWLFPRARGAGVATAAVRAAAGHAFAPEHAGGLGMTLLRAVTASDNEASNAVLVRAGFTSWGTEPGAEELSDGRRVGAMHWHLRAPDVEHSSPRLP